jgi:hypothetical protein
MKVNIKILDKLVLSDHPVQNTFEYLAKVSVSHADGGRVIDGKAKIVSNERGVFLDNDFQTTVSNYEKMMGQQAILRHVQEQAKTTIHEFENPED